MADAAAPREAWNFEAFERHYNEIAREFGGWNYDRSSRREDSLRLYYESPIYESLRDFARTIFQSDQQV